MGMGWLGTRQESGFRLVPVNECNRDFATVSKKAARPQNLESFTSSQYPSGS